MALLDHIKIQRAIRWYQEGAAFQGAVRDVPHEARSNTHHEIRTDCQQVAVEQAMDVCSKQQPFLDTMVLRSGERLEVSRFKHFRGRWACYGADHAVLPYQGFAEDILPEPNRCYCSSPASR